VERGLGVRTVALPVNAYLKAISFMDDNCAQASTDSISHKLH